jgi:hypothetical protein
MTLKQQAEKQRRQILKRWKERQRRWDFARCHSKQILSLSDKGWPKLATSCNPDYLKWLDLVYKAKGAGIYSLNTANCDIIANLKSKAEQLQKIKVRK